MAHGTGRAAALAVTLGLVLSACGPSEPQGANTDSDQVDAVAAPDVDVCRVLGPDDLLQPSNATRTVPCEEPHTARTFAVAELPETLFDDPTAADPAAPGVGAHVFETCEQQMRAYLGADESTSMRSHLGWVWFAPSREAWDDGARWFRCDLVAGPDREVALIDLPAESEGLLEGRPRDRWMTCATGETPQQGESVACSEPHEWRAVTTIKLGEPEDAYPGDSQVEAVTRDFCSDSVSAWLNYPVDFDYAFTWFHQAEWDAGNRRSICWARTTE